MSLCHDTCTGDHSRPRGAVYAISNAIVVTDTDDVIDAACRARRMWNDRHPGTVMPEGMFDPVGHCVWFPRPNAGVRRCVAVIPGIGQCRRAAIFGSERCPNHLVCAGRGTRQ